MIVVKIALLYLCSQNKANMTQTLMQSQKEQHDHFNAAKSIALIIPSGQMRRAKVGDVLTSYIGAKDNSGRMWVIGDSLNDIQNPDAYIGGKPAREISGDFTVMSAHKVN